MQVSIIAISKRKQTHKHTITKRKKNKLQSPTCSAVN